MPQRKGKPHYRAFEGLIFKMRGKYARQEEGRYVCSAISKAAAKRIARALNQEVARGAA